MTRALASLTALALAATLLVASQSLAQTANERIYRLGVVGMTEITIRAARSITLPALERLGFVEGRNLILEARVGTPDQLPRLMAELLATGPDVIMATGGDAIEAARRATSTVPIVMFGPDPIDLGFAQSLARPGGNVTGIMILAAELDAKRLHLLHEAVPAARRVAALHRAGSPNRPTSDRDMRAVAAGSGLELISVDAAGPPDYPAAFAAMRAAGAQALAIAADPTLYRDRARLATLALEARLPTICQWREMAEDGCLLSYGPSLTGLRARLTDYVVRIFRGAAAGDLPIEQPTNFELVVNLKTARTLGIEIPPALLARADEVIE